MGMNQIASDLYKALTESDERKPKAGDVKATVIREEGDTVWVKFPGGEDETPVQKTNNATVGDEVMVRTADGRAWILGNNTNPATDDTEAKKASHKAVEAFDAASFAAAAAETAQVAADSAVRSAEIANDNAVAAQSSAYAAQSSAIAAQSYADQALHNSEAAQDSADATQNYAYMAMSQLGIVENIVGVLDLVAKNGEYQVTTDTTVQPDKWYFTRSGTDPDYIYTIVNNPTGNPSIQGYYELVNIDAAIKNYVSSHLVLDENGLWLQHGRSNTKLLLSASGGVILYNQNNDPIAQYGAEAIIGAPTSFNIRIGGTNNEIGFYQGANKAAYVNGQELYVENSLSFGRFIFYQRQNGHFTLKLV